MRRVKVLKPTRSDMIRATDDFFHLFNRGVDKQQIFFSDYYYALFLELTRRYHEPAGMSILAYCLMPNHFHFLVKQLKAFAMSRFMEQLAAQFAKELNLHRERSGHLFQGPYQMKWVPDEQKVPIVANYIHQNPVKAGLVNVPEGWEFSSCREYFGQRTTGFLDLNEVLSRLDGVSDYRTFLDGAGDAEEKLPIGSRFHE